MSDSDRPVEPWPAPRGAIEPIVATYAAQRDEWVWAWKRIRERWGATADWQFHAVALAALAIGVFGLVRDGWGWFPIFFLAVGSLVYVLHALDLALPYLMYRRIPEDRATQRLVVAESAIESGTDDYRVRVPWSSIRDVVRGETAGGGEIVVLPVLDQKDAFIIPRRALDDDQWARLQTLLDRWTADDRVAGRRSGQR